jgi:hypothetical protein
MLQPFIPYYGAKWKLAQRLVPPQRTHVIEPFAGGAGYSCYWEPPKVTLIELNPVVYGVWKYLQGVSPAELKRLPSNISHINELPSRVCEEARALIGFWFDARSAKPAHNRSNWAKIPCLRAFYWSETIKWRLASQVHRIRHWKIKEGSYEQVPDVEAHWHIDPPYNNTAGRSYRCHNLDYRALGKWCKRRRGFVQVCENDGAKWLPFKPLTIMATHRPTGYTAEAVYETGKAVRRVKHKATECRKGDE